VVKALERVSEQLLAIPDALGRSTVEARRADALVALASARIASDPDPDRATVVVHVPVEVLAGDRRDDAPGASIEGGGVIHPETARRLACTARIETVIEDQTGRVVGLGRTSREPSAQMLRALRHRDHGCRFPGCGSRRYVHAHHIRWWSGGGRTDLDNLVMVCSFHHALVHEHRWRIKQDRDGTVSWFHPNGVRYRAGPAPVPLRA
jgi:hypothetical protein